MDGFFRRARFGIGGVRFYRNARIPICNLARARARAARAFARASVAARTVAIVEHAAAKCERACRARRVGFVLGNLGGEYAALDSPRCECHRVGSRMARLSARIVDEHGALWQHCPDGFTAVARFERPVDDDVFSRLSRRRGQRRVWRAFCALDLFGSGGENVIGDKPRVQARAAMFTSHSQFVWRRDARFAIWTNARVTPMQEREREQMNERDDEKK